VVKATHVQKGCGASKEQLSHPEAGTEVGAFLVMGGFQGPNPFREPLHKGSVLGHSPKEGLAKVDVTLHKTGKNPVSTGIHTVRALHFQTRSYFNDCSVSNTQIGVRWGHIIGTGEKQTALEKQMHAHRPNKSG
jgi:hypothetical protein